jgi:DNA replication protein DnaC
MEQKDYEEKWTRCLQVIKEQLNNQHVFDVWFSGIVFERYDEAAKTVTLQVPSNYVYEYIEQYHVPLMQKALNPVFGAGVVLRYRIMKQKPSFADVAGYLRQHSAYDPQRNPYNIHVTDAEKRLKDGLHYFLKGSEQWLPAYGQIADWLQDNKGRGLLCVGHQGLGKTLICEKILPVILGNGGHPIPCVSGPDICHRLDELLNERIVVIDDLGKEPSEATVNYLRRRPFFELCNNAERTGQLLIITTNLATARPASWPADRPWPWPDSIEHRYGQEVLDRLKVITKMVRFEGESMRK